MGLSFSTEPGVIVITNAGPVEIGEEEKANQNQAALRALNDKIDRMFETIARK